MKYFPHTWSILQAALPKKKKNDIKNVPLGPLPQTDRSTPFRAVTDTACVHLPQFQFSS